MIDSLSIEGFKCFDRITIHLRRINIFSGTNSSGKSSAIQAFLLLCNNSLKPSSSPLNGIWLRLGSFDECRNHRTNARVFTVGVSSRNHSFQAQFQGSYDDNEDVSVAFIHKSDEIQNFLNVEKQHIYYLPANRIGPEDAYLKNFDQINFLGQKAEYIVDFLYKNRKQKVSPSLVADTASITLEYQVNYWLKKLFRINNTIRDLGLSNSLSMELSLDKGKPVRPYHIGSGVSFAMGVLVSCLSASPDDIVIIENPEIHLHPKAQSELTEFLCFAANAGIQILLETHSDHVFNGIRKSIVQKNLVHTDVAVHFFQLDENALALNTAIELNEYGRILEHPNGLFDQFDDDLDQILGL
jgi:predicted ATPase